MEQEALSYLTIFIYPPEEIVLNIIALQNIIANRLYITEGIFDNDLYRPHITLCSALFYKDDADLLKKEILNTKFNPLRIQLDNEVNDENGFLSIRCSAQNLGLKNLHLQFAELFAKHRKGLLREKYSGDISNYSADEQESIRRYGSPRYGKLYNPHISILQIEANKVPEIQDVLDSWKVEDSFDLQDIKLIEHSEDSFGNNPNSIISVENVIQ